MRFECSVRLACAAVRFALFPHTRRVPAPVRRLRIAHSRGIAFSIFMFGCMLVFFLCIMYYYNT